MNYQMEILNNNKVKENISDYNDFILETQPNQVIVFPNSNNYDNNNESFNYDDIVFLDNFFDNDFSTKSLSSNEFNNGICELEDEKKSNILMSDNSFSQKNNNYNQFYNAVEQNTSNFSIYNGSSFYIDDNFHQNLIPIKNVSQDNSLIQHEINELKKIEFSNQDYWTPLNLENIFDTDDENYNYSNGQEFDESINLSSDSCFWDLDANQVIETSYYQETNQNDAISNKVVNEQICYPTQNYTITIVPFSQELTSNLLFNEPNFSNINSIIQELIENQEVSKITNQKEINFEKLKLHLKGLCHGDRCIRKDLIDVNNKCDFTNCSFYKFVLNHIKDCKNGKMCDYSPCYSGRQLITHFKQCKKTNCNLCIGIKSN